MEEYGGGILRICSGWLAWLREASIGLRRKSSFIRDYDGFRHLSEILVK